MAISDRINEMYTHVGDVYDTITNVDLPTNKNIQNIPSTMRSSYLDIMNNGIDKIWNNWEKVEGTGETITLNSTEEAPMKIDLKGNTSQETTTGKNLFNIEGRYETGTGITYTKNDDGSYTLNGTANGNNFLRGLCYLNEQHTISYTSNTENSNVIIRTRTGTPTAQTGIQDQLFVSSTSGSLTSSKQFDFVEISIVNGTTLNNFKIYIQLEKGSSVTSYEPYTNGASPNPDYPQDIHVVSGDNTVKVENKNLTLKNVKGYLGNSSILVDNGSESFVFYATEGETYTFSSQTAMNRGQYAKVETLNVVNNTPITNKTSISVLPSYNSASFTCSFTGYCIVYVNSTKKDAIGETFQIEKGSSPTSYVAHTEASYHITLPEGMFLGWIPNTDYRDKIDKSTGKNLFDNSLLNKEIAYQATTSISNGVLTITSISSTGVSFARLLPTLTLLPNTQYTCSFDINGAFLQARIYDVDANNYTTIATSTSGSRVSGTFTTSSNTTYELVLYITLQQSCSFSKIQVEQGSIATEYEPYGKVWYLNKQIGKVVLNGSENWTKSSNTNVNRYYIPGIFINTILNVSTIDLISDYFTCITPIQSDAYNIGLAKLNNTSIMVNFSLSDTNFDTLQKFTTWLSTHNTIVYYVLATPTYTEITDTTLLSQLEAVKKSYTTQTNISQENNDKPFILDVTALKQLTQ